MGETTEDLLYDYHLQLLEWMRNPIAFHAEMMGNIIYLQQALRQPDAKESIQAIIKEIIKHMDWNNWTLKKDAKSLRTSKSCYLCGHYDAIAIS
jgi:hypothetical protein